VKAKPIFAATVEPVTNETYTSSRFNFSLIFGNTLTFNGYLEVYLPSEV
jgi:hypothetical protein